MRILLTLLLSMCIAAVANAERRVALLIGNAAYLNVADLNNPENDASDIAVSLERNGFEVDVRVNLPLNDMQRVLRDFQRKSVAADVSLIYYAGHGIEVNNRNFLIPTDATLQTDRDIAFETVPLENFILASEGAATLSLVIVDACRDNPFSATMERVSANRSIGRGLAEIEPYGNTLVAFAAKGGTTAADGQGRNSPYAAALIATLNEPGLEVGMLFRRVRDRVLADTGGAQEPFVYGSLSANALYLNNTDRPVPPPPADLLSSGSEVVLWNSIASSRDPRDFADFLALYPSGQFASFAKRRLEAHSLLENGTQRQPTQSDTARPIQTAALAVLQAEPQRQAILDNSGIRAVQEYLTVLKYAPGPIDGILGRRTTNAIVAYEADRGNVGTGAATQHILDQLRREVPNAQVQRFREARARAAAQRREAARVQAAAIAAADADETETRPGLFSRLFSSSNPTNRRPLDSDDDDDERASVSSYGKDEDTSGGTETETETETETDSTGDDGKGDGKGGEDDGKGSEDEGTGSGEDEGSTKDK